MASRAFEGWIAPNRLAMTVVVVSLVLLSAATVSLRSLHEHAREERIADHFQRGQQAIATHRLEDAAKEFRAALTLERDDVASGRALALTLLSLGRIEESDSHLRELLRENPTDGPLNRGLARIHALRGREAEARSAYQRAIYGEWPGDGVAERNATRFEFIDYLTKIGARDEVLSELLRLRAELPSGRTAAARRAADLLVEFGAADLAIETLRTTALTAPKDVELLAHLAELQANAGMVRDARVTLRTAVGIEPGRSDLDERLHIVNRILALDPTLPRLGLVTRTRRARLLLEQVVESTKACADEPAVKTLRETGRERLRTRARADAEAAEEDLALAAKIWAAAPACQAASLDARAIGQVLQRVTAATEPGT
jgi:tetratricopeptide (TPR) repeat protein